MPTKFGTDVSALKTSFVAQLNAYFTATYGGGAVKVFRRKPSIHNWGDYKGHMADTSLNTLAFFWVPSTSVAEPDTRGYSIERNHACHLWLLRPYLNTDDADAEWDDLVDDLHYDLHHSDNLRLGTGQATREHEPWDCIAREPTGEFGPFHFQALFRSTLLNGVDITQV